MGSVSQLLVPDSIDFAAYYRDSAPEHRVIPASKFAEQVVDDLAGLGEQGAKLPWAKSHDLIRLRDGEVSLWCGINGHGKSLLTGMVASGLCLQDERVCIASFEMKPRRTLGRMCRQASRGDRPSEAFARAWLSWLDRRLWLYDQQGTVDPDTVLGVIRWCADKLGVKHFVIDSLMKCVASEEDYDGQKAFLDSVTALARDLAIHVHLVHHIRKGSSEHEVPGKFAVKGSGSITDQADNVFIVWKNKKKMDLIQMGEHVDDETTPDAMLICEKQRNGEYEGKVALWFDPKSQQFTSDARRTNLTLSGVSA